MIRLTLGSVPVADRHPGRRPVDDRAALAGIVFVLRTGISSNQLNCLSGWS
jgi:transposase